MLTHVLYINVAAQVVRRAEMCRTLSACGVPDTCIHRIDAVDGRRFDSVSAMLDALVDAGYPEFGGSFALQFEEARGTLGYMWSYRNALQWICAFVGDGQVLVLIDDVHLVRPWADYVALAESLANYEVISLHNIIDLPIGTLCPEDNRFQIGARCRGDSAIIYTASGAAAMLELMACYPYNYVESVYLDVRRASSRVKVSICSSVEPVQAFSRNAWVDWRNDESYRKLVDKEDDFPELRQMEEISMELLQQIVYPEEDVCVL